MWIRSDSFGIVRPEFIHVGRRALLVMGRGDEATRCRVVAAGESGSNSHSGPPVDRSQNRVLMSTAVSRYMRISTEILVSAYGLFWAKPPRFAPASLAAGARGSTLLPPPSSVRPMQLHVCSSYASLCYAASLPQPGDRNTAAKRGREDSRHGGALVLRRTTWSNPARLGVRARLKLLFDLFSGFLKYAISSF